MPQYVELPSGSVQVNTDDENAFFSAFSISQLSELKNLVEIKILAQEKIRQSFIDEEKRIAEKSIQINQMLADMDARLAEKQKLAEQSSEIVVTKTF
jgi:hypothetical protein